MESSGRGRGRLTRAPALDKLGVNAYVVEPVDFQEFVNAVKETRRVQAVINQPPPVGLK